MFSDDSIDKTQSSQLKITSSQLLFNILLGKSQNIGAGYPVSLRKAGNNGIPANNPLSVQEIESGLLTNPHKLSASHSYENTESALTNDRESHHWLCDSPNDQLMDSSQRSQGEASSGKVAHRRDQRARSGARRRRSNSKTRYERSGDRSEWDVPPHIKSSTVKGSEGKSGNSKIGTRRSSQSDGALPYQRDRNSARSTYHSGADSGNHNERQVLTRGKPGRQRPRFVPLESNLTSLSDFCITKASTVELSDAELIEKRRFLTWLETQVRSWNARWSVSLFGSLANGFAMMNSDMDICVCPSDNHFESSQEKYEEIAKVLYEVLVEDGYEVQRLDKTRVPIVRVLSDSRKRFKFNLKCDIGSNNQVARYNTELLLKYSKLDPRVKNLILFVKHWSKARRINDTYHGTLCSYGYSLLMLHYLIKIARPPVLPNLQTDLKESERRIFQEYDVSFRQNPHFESRNTDSLGKLLFGFFHYYSTFSFQDLCISIRSPKGFLTKESKGWTKVTEQTSDTNVRVRNRYFIAIEDPFETSHNVARTVTERGFYKIRDELRRAQRLICSTGQRFEQIVLEKKEPKPRPERERKPKAEGDDAPDQDENDHLSPDQDDHSDEDIQDQAVDQVNKALPFPNSNRVDEHEAPRVDGSKLINNDSVDRMTTLLRQTTISDET